MKKFFITLMCIIMVVCFMPTVALAEGETPAANMTGAEFIDLADTEGNIVLEEDINLTSTVEIEANKSIVLDLNGHKITVAVNSGSSSDTRHYYAIDNYGTFTLKDSVGGGSITARGIENLGKGVMTIESGKIISQDSNGGACIWNEATLFINGGLFNTLYEGTSSDTYGPGCLNNRGSAVITAGKFESVNKRTYAIISTGDIEITPAEGKTVNVAGAHGGLGIDAGTAVVNGGTYTSTDYYGLYVSNDGVGTDPMTAAVTVNGGTFSGAYYSVWIGSDHNKPVNSTIRINDGEFQKPLNAQENTREGAIVVAGGTFSDLSALNYVVDGAKIKLSKDAIISSEIHVDKELTIDLNGKNITSLGRYALSVIAGGKLTLEGSGKVSAQYCALALTGSGTDDGSKCVANIGEDVTLSAPYYGAIIWQKNVDEKTGTASYGVELNLDGKIEGTDTNSAGIFVLGNIKATEGNVPVLNLGPNASVKGRVAVALNGYGQLNVNGATVEGTDTGIEVRAGKLNVNSGTITGKGSPTNVQPNGSGTTTSGAGIGVAQHTTKLPVDVTINDGTISGYTALHESNPQLNEESSVNLVNINVKGGTFNAINDGRVAVNSDSKRLSITGGTFSTDPTAYVPVESNYRVRTNSNGTYTVYHYTPYVPSIPTDSLKTARTEAIKAVTDYVNPADYEEAQQAEIKTIVDNAKKNIEAAKTADEIKAIEAAAKAELDKLETAEEMALIRTIEGTQFTARSKATTLNGKKAIRVTWNKPADLDFDGYEIYRSTERYKGYGTEPFFTTTNQKYTNNKGLKVGKTYYYKVRGFKYVNDEKVYTEYSLKAWRTVK